MTSEETPAAKTASPPGEGEIAERIKEGIYATITGLAIVLVYLTGDEHDRAEHALFSLVIGVFGITAAGFLADVLAHIAVARHLPDRRQALHLLAVAGGAIITLVVPVLLSVAAVVGILTEHAALLSATIVYIATLAVVGLAAIRRVRLVWWLRLLVLAALVVLGLLVVALQVVAHSA